MISGEQTLEEAISSLKSSSSGTRRKAARQLGKLGSPIALEALTGALKDEDPAVVHSVIVSLSKIGGEETVQALIPLLEESSNTGLRNAVVEIFQRMEGHFIEPLIPLLDHSDVDARKFVVDILGMVGTPEVHQPIANCLNDLDPNVRCSAEEALGKLKAKDCSDAIFKQIQEEKETWVVFHLLEALTMTGSPALVEKMMDIPLEKLGVCQEVVLDTVAEIGSPENLEQLLHRIDANKPSMTAHLIQAILRIAERSKQPDFLQRCAEQYNLKEHLQKLIHHDDMVVRLNCMVLLDCLDGLSSEEAKELFKSPHADVRLQALKTMVRLGGVDLKQHLSSAMDEPDAKLRYEVIVALPNDWISEFEPRLIEMLKREVTLVQMGILKALFKGGTKRSVTIVRELLVSENPQLRKEAEKTLFVLERKS